MTDSRVIADALVFPYLNHAVWMFEEGYATREDIDAGMRYGCGLPVGPLALLDAIGLEPVVEELRSRHPRTGDPLHEPRPLLLEMIAAGKTGKAAGKGFYTYAAPGADEVVADELTPSGSGGAGARDLSLIGVVGSGTMATGIIEVLAKAGYEVIYVARGEDKVAGVRAAIEKSQAKAISRGKSTQEAADALLSRITGATDREALSQVDLVIEAIAEDLAIKQQLFRDLDRICKPGAVLATTTSSLAIADLAAQTSRPADVVGLHFFNPATVMKLVEIIRTPDTADDVVASAEAICAATGKVGVHCGDRAGFIVNCLLFPYLNDAVELLDNHEAEVEAIDSAITEHYGYPMGPFALLDVVGNDVSLAIQVELEREFGGRGFEPALGLAQKVAAGKLGRKTGEGFHSYA